MERVAEICNQNFVRISDNFMCATCPGHLIVVFFFVLRYDTNCVIFRYLRLSVRLFVTPSFQYLHQHFVVKLHGYVLIL